MMRKKNEKQLRRRMAAAAPTTKGADMTAAGMERDVVGALDHCACAHLDG